MDPKSKKLLGQNSTPFPGISERVLGMQVEWRNGELEPPGPIMFWHESFTHFLARQVQSGSPQEANEAMAKKEYS